MHLSIKPLMTFMLAFSLHASATTVSVMNYNVENLFDTKHDIGKEDYTYLPKATKDASPEIQAYCKSLSKERYIKDCLELDWNEDVLFQKFTNLKEVIRQYNFGLGADILVLQEVENQNVVNMFIRHELKSLGYKYSVVLEGEDSRGIDTGVISKYPIVSAKMHKIDLTGIAKKTRGILQADINVEGKKVSILANHWPSQGNPTQARAKAAKTLNKIAKGIKSDLIIATGDFNVVPTRDIPNPLTTITKKAFIDTEQMARKFGGSIHAGTHWFGGTWTSLDKMYVHRTSLISATPIYPTFKILIKDFMLGSVEWTHRDTGEVVVYDGVPMRFSHLTGEGYSDHLPIVMKFFLK
jgi:endonuclease/exonuclease/phosphatase family metal-dependent hydrolase